MASTLLPKQNGDISKATTVYESYQANAMSTSYTVTEAGVYVVTAGAMDDHVAASCSCNGYTELLNQAGGSSYHPIGMYGATYVTRTFIVVCKAGDVLNVSIGGDLWTPACGISIQQLS